MFGRRSVCLKVPALLLVLALGCAPAAPPASKDAALKEASAAGQAKAGTEQEAQLYEAARKEGELVLYSSNNLEDTREAIAGFEKKYPGITVKHVRAVRDELTQKAISEFQAGRVAGDIFQTASFSVADVQKAGALDVYQRPDLSVYPNDLKDPNNIWSVSAMLLYAPGYNTTKVKPAEAPKSYEELLDPKWKGRMAVHELETQVTISMMDWWGKEKTVEYWRGIAALTPRVLRGRSLMLDLLVPGEYDLAASLHTSSVSEKKAQGAPVEWVHLERHVADFTGEALMRGAPHPSAAKLYLNWLVGLEGQKTLVAAGRVPVHPQVPSNPPELKQGLKLYALAPTAGDRSAEADRLYKEAFGIK